jgi:hypothetical protein
MDILNRVFEQCENEFLSLSSDEDHAKLTTYYEQEYQRVRSFIEKGQDDPTKEHICACVRLGFVVNVGNFLKGKEKLSVVKKELLESFEQHKLLFSIF